MGMRHVSIVLLLGIGFAMPATAQNFEEGKEAYDRGDYETALREWRPLPKQDERFHGTNEQISISTYEEIIRFLCSVTGRSRFVLV